MVDEGPNPQKEREYDIAYSESKVPYYELPDLLTTIEGRRVSSVEEWERVRRPQIMGLLAGNIYGRIPLPEEQPSVRYETLSTDTACLDGRCTRKHLRVHFANACGEVRMHLVVYTPNSAAKPVPTILQLTFLEVATDKGIDTSNIQAYGNLKDMPLVHFLDKGFGVARIQGGEIVRDEHDFKDNSIHRLFYRGNQSLPRADEWGVLGGIAWQASRALDYLEIDEDVDHTRVAIEGHSKLGKCALWAAAVDTRFAMALSQNSGCAGAALWRRRFGENMKYMFRANRWLCENARKYVGNEDDLPVDQHMLLACIAPRPVYVTSGIDDYFADPMGEYLGAHHATPAFELYGQEGQPTPTRPEINHPVENRALSYVIRTFGHGYSQRDWDRYIRCMEFHL